MIGVLLMGLGILAFSVFMIWTCIRDDRAEKEFWKEYYYKDGKIYKENG